MNAKNLNKLGGGDVARHTSRHGISRGEKRAAECRIATLNVQGGMKDKVEEVCQLMKERRIEILGVSETKRKGKDVSQHGTYMAVWSGVPETKRACQGVGIIISDRLVHCMKGYECVSPRLLWIRLKIGLTPIFILAVYAPNMSCPVTEREEFWESVTDILNTCKANERVILLGDFNSWVGVEREGYECVLGKYGDTRVNENGVSLLEVCLEKDLVVTNTLFEHKEIHRYTWERNDSKSLIDFVVVDRRLRSKVVDTRSFRGVNVGTDHHLVICRMSDLFKAWRHRKQKTTTSLRRIKVEKLREVPAQEEYIRELHDRTSHLWEETYEGGMEETWDAVKTNIVETATKVCGDAKVKSGRLMHDNWWDDEVKEAVESKKRAWLNILAMKAKGNLSVVGNANPQLQKAKYVYAEAKKKVKKVVSQKKENMKESFDKKLSDDFRANLKLFWKQVRLARGLSGASKLSVIRNDDGRVLSNENEILQRWKGYFQQVFECNDSGTVIGNDPMEPSQPIHDAGNDITEDEIMKAMKCMKVGKAAGYDRITVEMLRSGKSLVVKLLWRLFNVCWRNGRVPEDWCKAIIVPLYKGKGSQQECRNYRGISLLSVVGKLYAKILIERVINVTEEKLWDVQAGFRRGMGCTDQIFSIRIITEKHLAKSKRVFCAFVDLEKAYDRVQRNELWSTLRLYGVDSHLVRALESLYENSKACIRVNGAYTGWFNILKGVRQGCVASPWLFNLYMDSCLSNLKDMECGLNMNESHIKCLLYADDQVLLAPSAVELQDVLDIMNGEYKKKGMKINVSKTKVMVIEREENVTTCNIVIDGVRVDQVNEFVYLGSMISRDGRCDKDIERRVTAGNKVNGALHAVVSSQAVSQKARLAVHNGVLVPTLMYGSESWIWQKKNESRVNAVEMRSLRSMCGVTLADRMRNSVIRDLCKLKHGVVTRIEKGMLQWFGHLERMSDNRLTKRIYRANVSGSVDRGRPRKTYFDQINYLLQKGQIRSTLNRRKCMTRCMNVNEAKEVCQNRSMWQAVVSAYPHGIPA